MMRFFSFVTVLTIGLSSGMGNAQAVSPDAPTVSAYKAIDQIFDDFRLDQHIPGLAYGVVVDGQLVHMRSFGVQDIETGRPVNADTLFRIASMTKAFTALTILKLRDEGRVRLDDPVETYVPEMKGWTYPTSDSPRIRVRHLLNHVAGFVTDDPWGDRQTPMTEEDFTALLKAGVPFTRAPAMAHEYSNLGYAILGRVITNVSRQPYDRTIISTLMRPLGMTDTGFKADQAPMERRALGYRWEDNNWKPEPFLGHGAFGAMGGVQTSANDYAKWVAFLLSAWPPRDETDKGPVKRASVRELAEGSNFPAIRPRPGKSGADSCREAITYGMGMRVAVDCDLGLTLSHSGGYPGYGSHLLLMPDRGVGIFAFANRTYGAPVSAVWDAAITLNNQGLLAQRRQLPVSSEIMNAHKKIIDIYQSGSLQGHLDDLAMNFLMDRDLVHWAHDLADLKAQAGNCASPDNIKATGALTAEFTWRCDHGRIRGGVELSPTQPPRLQQLELTVIRP